MSPFYTSKIATNMSQRTVSRSFYELLSSMRFAISLFTILAIASVVGTVLKQNQPYTDYIIKFGQFWFVAFKALGLFDVYHTGWFIVILAFLVLSTSLCIWRNWPAMLRDMRSYRESATEQSLRHFHHQAEFPAHANSVSQLRTYLTTQGWKYREDTRADGILLAAKRGSANRLGYLLTHSAIVLICIGGLVDGNLPLQFQEAIGTKKIETRDIPASEVPPISRLSANNLSFRGDVTIPEGSSADIIFINSGDGYLVQELPFRIALDKFFIEHYTTGQPKSFASNITILDKSTGKPLLHHTIKVNHPLVYDGVAIYQASFGDGGTRLRLNGWNVLNSNNQPFPFGGVVHERSSLASDNLPLTVEFTEFHPFNIEGSGDAKPQAAHLGGNAVADNKDLHNVGPSFEYKIRAADGTAHAYNNYMLPVQIDKRWFVVSGMRSSPAEPYRYVRFPLDPDATLTGFMSLRAVLMNPTLYPEIAQRVTNVIMPDNPTARAQLTDSTIKVLTLFGQGGFKALSDFIEQRVPADQRDRAAETYLKILEMCAWQAWGMARSDAHLSPPVANEASGWFLRDSLNAISDLFFYGSPVYLQLSAFDQVQSSGFQLTRSPGKNIVYFGSFLLVLGVFAMFFIHERRLWLLVRPDRILCTMSGNRLTLDFENEFRQRCQDIARIGKES